MSLWKKWDERNQRTLEANDPDAPIVTKGAERVWSAWYALEIVGIAILIVAAVVAIVR